jgi:hypothetical protein
MLSLVPRPPFGAARGGRCASENLQRLHWSGRHRPARDSRAASIRSLQLIAAEALIADWGPRMLSISRITILSCRIEQRVRNEATSIFLANFVQLVAIIPSVCGLLSDQFSSFHSEIKAASNRRT